HLKNDLFSAFRDEIQAQILKPLQDAIVEDDMSGSLVMGPNLPGGGVKLHKFEIKPFKTTASSVVKLLARPERVALTILDKLGVRFVTKSLFDSFSTIKILREQNMMSFAHVIPDQSNNTLYPINLFMEVMEDLQKQAEFGLEISNDEIREKLNQRLEEQASRAKFLEKGNEFSGPEYRFLKFINRKLITVNIGEGENKRAFRFFYPFEVQIMDQETYNRNLAGPMAHDEYKNRQRKKARERVMGDHLL
ncbi:MAG: TIGR04552 family protein, partial [Proteobacteria bacterium]